MAEIRQSEQRAAAAAVGVTDVRFQGYPDGRVTPSLELRRDLSREIRRYRPQRVLCPSPERNWERIYAGHPDHLAVGEAAVCAVYPDARNPFAHTELLDEEGLEPHTVPQLWIGPGPAFNRFVDITDVFDRKIAALRCHKSQVGEGDQLEERLRPWMAGQAREAGLPEGRLAEAFRAVDIL
jgi:LmbE family N-acetylglucosaminyl deacetylase